ncbi:MAG TPA: zinc-binding dehydrogenase, partial [Nitrososphaerales archaeon]|nr:zinc-binding dehydrogenase [Nitrososphaerales archaeon]
GATTGAEVVTDLRYVFNRELTIFGSYMAGSGELLLVANLFRGGRLKPVLDSVFPLKDAADAQRKMESGAHFGKIVLKV